MQPLELSTQSDDGHRWSVLARIPEAPRARVLWLPALGVAAKHYLPLAEALAQRGIAAFVHEWRGIGSSTLRASRARDWGYRELLLHDLPVSERLMDRVLPALPRVLGGHSLGGQIACCRRALAPDSARALWLVASGAPYWRAFPISQRYVLRLVYRVAPWLADRNGTLPGRRLRFAGNEARSLIRDWATTGLSGRYTAHGVEADLETRLNDIAVPIRAIRLAHDWMVPQGSLDYLLAKMPSSHIAHTVIDDRALGTKADHFAWMKTPDAVVEALCNGGF